MRAVLYLEVQSAENQLLWLHVGIQKARIQLSPAPSEDFEGQLFQRNIT